MQKKNGKKRAAGEEKKWAALTKYYRVLQSTTKYYRVLQNTTEYFIAI